MLTKIDWMSFSVTFPFQQGRGTSDVLSCIAHELDALHPELIASLHMEETWIPGKGRAPYSHSLTWANGGIVLFYSHKTPHAVIEISGKGCDLLQADGNLLAVLFRVKERLTRIDIACDMLCDTRPLDFVAQRDQGRFKAHSEVVSASGETCYVGSRKSNRYARVYRYNAPHERSQFLRSEFVMKAEDAKLTAEAVLENGLTAVATSLGVKFGWQHETWQPLSNELAELKSYRADRREGKTLFWLNETIAPLLLRLHNEGTIDIFQWFAENVHVHLDPTIAIDPTTPPLDLTFTDIPF